MIDFIGRTLGIACGIAIWQAVTGEPNAAWAALILGAAALTLTVWSVYREEDRGRA